MTGVQILLIVLGGLGLLLLLRMWVGRKINAIRAAGDADGAALGLAFVLLPDTRPPSPAAVNAALEQMPGVWDEVTPDDEPGKLELALPSGGDVVGMVMPAPVPDGEAEDAAARSLAAYLGAGEVGEHAAHMILACTGLEAGLQGVTEFTRSVAAVAMATNAAGVVWAAGHVCHPTAFFTELARDMDLPVPAWIGVSSARPTEDQASLLSVGMSQFGLRDLLLTCKADGVGDGMEFFFDLLTYSIGRGAVPEPGETIGRTEEVSAHVTEAPSPIEAGETVWCVALDAAP